jgi:hypothetical protein
MEIDWSELKEVLDLSMKKGKYFFRGKNQCSRDSFKSGLREPH